jgi:predicted alpha/beta hydrolase
MKAETITAADGMKLAVRVYEPDSPDRGSVVIGGAMGVRQDYYAPFAQWLAGRGWRVLTFDYRGSGDSGPNGSALRGFPCARSRSRTTS